MLDGFHLFWILSCTQSNSVYIQFRYKLSNKTNLKLYFICERVNILHKLTFFSSSSFQKHIHICFLETQYTKHREKWQNISQPNAKLLSRALVWLCWMYKRAVWIWTLNKLHCLCGLPRSLKLLKGQKVEFARERVKLFRFYLFELILIYFCPKYAQLEIRHRKDDVKPTRSINKTNCTFKWKTY